MNVFKLPLLVVLAAMLLAGAASANVYDLNADFGLANPNGAWTYGWSDVDFTAFHPYNVCFTSETGSAYWGNGPNPPSVWKNYGPEVCGVPTGWVSLHPGPNCEPCVVRWTAPEGATSASVVGSWLPGDVWADYCSVRVNNVEVWGRTDSGSFDLTTPLQAGDTIDFAVSRNFTFGNTPLDATITTTSSVPEPSALLALVSGLGCLIAVRRRR